MTKYGPAPSDRFLLDRWTQSLVGPALGSLLRGSPDSPFGHTSLDADNSFHDFRGFPFRDILRNISLSDIDFTAACVQDAGMMFDVQLTNCSFQRAAIGTNISGDFRSCSFLNANLVRANLCTDSRLVRCDFTDANLNQATGAYATFEYCLFTNARMRGTSFLRSVLHECDWRGVQFHHASLGRSWITKRGFPVEAGVERPEALLPDVILDGVHWMSPDEPLSLHTGPVRAAELDLRYHEALLSLRLRFREELDRGKPLRDIPELAQTRHDAALTRAEQVAIQAAREAYHEYQVSEGKRHFKAGHFHLASHAFHEAAAFGPLDPSEAKYCEIARRRFDPG